jgi:hypothetical protein
MQLRLRIDVSATAGRREHERDDRSNLQENRSGPCGGLSCNLDLPDRDGRSSGSSLRGSSSLKLWIKTQILQKDVAQE